MKKVAILLLCLALTAFAATRTSGGSGYNDPAFIRGSYTVLDSWDPALPSSAFGIAIKDDVANSLWISSWGDCFTYEFNISTGNPTGDAWPITGAIDADDMGYCEYGTGNQFLIGDFTFSNIGVFDDAGTFVKGIDGPPAWANVFGIAGGHDMLYASRHPEIGWGSYTGTETEVIWTTAAFESVYGLATDGNYVFAACGITGADNIFIFSINADGSLDMTPVWSCEFTECEDGLNGSLDWDGTYLYAFPQNDYVYKLDIDWVPGSLDNSTWGEIKADF